MNDLGKLILSLFCMSVWAFLAATVVSVLTAVLVESCGVGHMGTTVALVATFAGVFSAVVYVWKHD